MPLNLLESNGDIHPLNFAGWDDVDSVRLAKLLDPDRGNEFTLQYPLPIINETEKFDESKIFLFKNRYGYKEDFYYNIELKNKRSGIIFPLKIYSAPGVLPAPEENQFLFRFLFIAYHHLLSGNTNVTKTIEDNDILKDQLYISDLYDENIIVFLYHTSNKTDFANFNILEYLPSFFKYGYVPVNDPSDFKNIEIQNINIALHPLYETPILDSLKIKKPKKESIVNGYIGQIFETIIKKQLPPLSRFILLYQVIELLIDEIAREYYRIKMPFDSKLSASMISTTKSTSFRDLKNKMKIIQDRIKDSIDSISSEDKRINLLFAHGCNLKIEDYEDFAKASMKILRDVECVLITDYVYQSRNRIVHNYYDMSVKHHDIDTLLTALNFEFEQLITDVVLYYDTSNLIKMFSERTKSENKEITDIQ